MKKIIALLLCFIMALSFVSCKGGNEEGDKDDFKVGFVHIGDENDKGYTANHHRGTLEMKEALGLKDSQIISKWMIQESAECEAALRELVEEGCKIIFATSFGFEEYVLKVAKEYPDVEFCHATGVECAKSELPNVHNYFANIFEGRYLAGIAAGLKTKTNKLGYVAAFNFAEVISGYTAFYLGAKSVNPDVTMDVIYVDSWYNVEKEKEAAETLIAGGCDVISQHSDSTGPASAAESAGVFHVGYNTDMTETAPNASLISSRINWGPYVTMAVEKAMEGKEIEKDWSAGLKDGAVALTELNTKIAAEGTQEKIDEAAKLIKEGELKVFAGPLYDVNDELVVKDGEHFPESEEASAPSWTYILKGIIIKE